MQHIKYLLLALFLVACSTPKESFDFGPGKGLGNKSITEVNNILDNSNGQNSVIAPKIDCLKFNARGRVERTPEQRMRVWIAPFQDNNGNFHEGSMIHTLVREGSWRVC